MALRSVDVLIQEHRTVERVLETLEGLIDDFLTNPEVPDAAKQELGEVSDYLARDLVLHIQKEDQGLFPALGKFLPTNEGPIAVMLSEHREIDQTHHELARGIAELEEHPSAGGRAAGHIRDHGRCLIQELRAHLYKEERVLFPFAETCLSEEDDREILRKFDSLEAGSRQSAVNG